MRSRSASLSVTSVVVVTLDVRVGDPLVALTLPRRHRVVVGPVDQHVPCCVRDGQPVLVVHIEPDTRHVVLGAVGRLEEQVPADISAAPVADCAAGGRGFDPP